MYYAVRTESDHVPPPGPMITVLASCAQRAALVATLGADPGVIFIGDPSPTQPLRTGATVRGAWAALAIAKRAGAAQAPPGRPRRGGDRPPRRAGHPRDVVG